MTFHGSEIPVVEVMRYLYWRANQLVSRKIRDTSLFLTIFFANSDSDIVHFKPRLMEFGSTLRLDTIEKARALRNLEGFFCFLGTDWVDWKKNSLPSIARGEEGFCPAPGHLVDGEVPVNNKWEKVEGFIDWGVDIKTGFRWPSNLSSTSFNISRTFLVGDIKIPWELGRLQHLPLIACLDLDECWTGSNVNYGISLLGQLEDFRISNPVGLGVNWVSPMDVGIRGVNLCLTLDILKSKGFSLPYHLYEQFCFQHMLFVSRNLEWSFRRNNHYLANVCSLIVMASYFPDHKISKQILKFAIPQFFFELQRQFNDDGSNFEGSTSYHRFSLEMVLVTVSILCGFEAEFLEKISVSRHLKLTPNSRVCEQFWQSKDFSVRRNGINGTLLFDDEQILKLWRAIFFLEVVADRHGKIPQVGDNDSGYFVGLRDIPADNQTGDLSNDVTSVFTVAAILGYTTVVADYFNAASALDSKLGRMIRCFSKGNSIFESDHRIPFRRFERAERSLVPDKVSRPSSSETVEKMFFSSTPITSLHHFHFVDFGLVVWRSDQVQILVRCITIGNALRGGHFHDDQLNVQVFIDGSWVLRDPGTYTYTHNPSLRSKFRCRASHFPFPENSRQDISGFKDINIPAAHILQNEPMKFVGQYEWDGFIDSLDLEIYADGKVAIQWARTTNSSRVLTQVDPGEFFRQTISPSYGVLLEEISEG